MKRVITVTAGAAAVAALAAACGTTSTASPSSPSPAASGAVAGHTASGSGTATLKTASSPEGQILVDGSGRTLYLFQADTGSTSTCTGACATAWPPVTSTGTPNAGGVNAALVGSTMRADHTAQVTYKGHPLYYFADDTKPGQVNGQGVDAFGAKWYVVSPNGAAVTAATSSNSSNSPSSGGGYGGGY
ncbi:hypothetical protein GXW83_20495 [Streptacidiphilus sp. PB12-B1b]|uniref:COG4315 family predicted lipoprotein n=1 Tax=Streptacidiphilus sp. PB12-B1b TaxID=2705012 RepID=UPI0015F92E89|nr:hypothetical protein [Streptacidiphilus sp. PB12-B1b]QMU77714.1 hypothetical protein GXW83_20495 [Streptacidiphilus sp. PB12-B1b]